MLVPKVWYVSGLGLNQSGEVLGSLREQGRVERWGHRAEIRHREDPSEVYVVLRGSVDMRDGAHQIDLRLRPGDVFGETGESASNSVIVAYDDTDIAAVDRRTFDETAGAALGTLITRAGLVRRQRVEVPASMLLYTPPQPRLAKVLLHLVETYGDLNDDTGRLGFSLHTRGLARVSGLARRSVSDIFDAMQREHIVEVGRTEIVIPSIELMRKLAIGERG